MFVKIEMGIGSPGKLWTGSDLPNRNLEKFARVELVEFHSPESGASTRRLFIQELLDEAPEGIRIPTLHIATGGVGSICAGRVNLDEYSEPTTSYESDKWLTPLLVWNWSGRVGGYLILDPVAVESGYVRRDEVNSALPGYAWICTYSGNTLSEYVLVRTAQVDSEEYSEQPAITSVNERHVLSVHRIVETLLAPPERPEPEEEVDEVSDELADTSSKDEEDVVETVDISSLMKIPTEFLAEDDDDNR